jgi:gas vesicle protein
MNGNAKTMLGILAAGAVGVTIGVLLTSEKGAELRKNIEDSICDLSDKLSDFMNSSKEKAKDIANDFQKHKNSFKKDVGSTIES